jgi:hypothetical protein
VSAAGYCIPEDLRDKFDRDRDEFLSGEAIYLPVFFQYELPKIESLAKSLLASNWITVEMNRDFF